MDNPNPPKECPRCPYGYRADDIIETYRADDKYQVEYQYKCVYCDEKWTIHVPK